MITIANKLENGNRCESGVKNKNYYVEWIYNLKLKNFAILLGDDHVSGQRNTRDQKFIIVRRHILSSGQSSGQLIKLAFRESVTGWVAQYDVAKITKIYFFLNIY